MILERLKNLWKLSEFQPGRPEQEYKEPGTIVSMIIKKPPQKAQFIPRIKQTPIEKVTKVSEETI